MLRISGLKVSYDGVAALHGVDLEVGEGDCHGLIGPNGAGKTTLAKAVSGTAAVEAGAIHLEDRDIGSASGHERVSLGIIHVPQGRRVFPALTVAENLEIGAYRAGAREGAVTTKERVHEMFPVLADKRNLSAGELSGGQQQMLAIGRGLMGNPRLLILDEPSMGLAPIVVEEIFDSLKLLRAETTVSLLVIEQLAQEAMDISDHITLLESGSISASGPTTELVGNSKVVDAYLGQV